MTESTNEAYYKRQPLSLRFWQALGFRKSSARMDLIEWRADDSDKTFSPVVLVTNIYIRIDFMDRLRLLVSGKARLEVFTKTDATVSKVVSHSVFTVLEPNASSLCGF